MAEPDTSPRVLAFTAAVCAAAFVLQAAYIPAILAHYRIALGAHRSGWRERGEPLERGFVIIAVLLAIVAFGATLTLRLSAT